MAEFLEAVPVVGEALDVCTPAGRDEAIGALFGDFTRRAIAAGVDRTRFVEWFRPRRLFAAPVGRVRGRVLYFNNPKGKGKILGSDGVVYSVLFFTIAGPGVRSLEGGHLVEFVPESGLINGQPGFMATDVKKQGEADALDGDGGAG